MKNREVIATIVAGSLLSVGIGTYVGLEKRRSSVPSVEVSDLRSQPGAIALTQLVQPLLPDIGVIRVYTPESGSYGSSVDIGIDNEEYVLTAGHVMSAGSEFWHSGYLTCHADETIAISGTKTDGTADGTHIEKAVIESGAGLFSVDDNRAFDHNKPDEALMNAPTLHTPVLPIEQVGLQGNPKPNDIVEFTNFQATEQGEARSPSYVGANGTAAEYVGRVISIEGNWAQVLLGIDGSFGKSPDDTLTHGGSGGPVWIEEDGKPRLLGISNAVDGGPDNLVDVKTVEHFGVHITGAKPGEQFQISEVYMIHEKDVRNLKANLKKCN